MRSGLRPLGLSHPCGKHATTIQLHMIFLLAMSLMLEPFHPCRHYTITECHLNERSQFNKSAHTQTPLFYDPCVAPKSITAKSNLCLHYHSSYSFACRNYPTVLILALQYSN